MTRITHNPVPPYRVVEECLGHAMDYATYWEVVDANGDYPIDLLPDLMVHGHLTDKAWCERQAERLNKENGHGE